MHVYTPTAPIIVVCCHPCVTIIRLRQVVLRMRGGCAGAASPWFRLILGNVLLAEQRSRQSANAQSKENCFNGIRAGFTHRNRIR